MEDVCDLKPESGWSANKGNFISLNIMDKDNLF
jgi:hypothetical protein